MQLNAVVLPAPLGPIRPTISHSLTCRSSPSTAVSPPKRIVRSTTSSTDIARPDQGGRCRVTMLLVHRESVPGEPAGERSQHLAESARVEDHRLQQQPGTDDVGDVLLVVSVEIRPAEVPEQAAEQRVDEREERSRGDDAGAITETADDDHHDEDQGLVEPGRGGEVLV